MNLFIRRWESHCFICLGCNFQATPGGNCWEFGHRDCQDHVDGQYAAFEFCKELFSDVKSDETWAKLQDRADTPPLPGVCPTEEPQTSVAKPNDACQHEQEQLPPELAYPI